MAASKNYDVIIVGGGLAGLTLTCLLAGGGARVLCLDREAAATRTDSAFDGRTTAISFGSRRIMEAAGVWPLVAADACAIDRIDILDGGSPVLLSFDKAEVAGRSFGWIVENRLLRLALLEWLSQSKTATHLAPATVVDFAREAGHASVRLADGRTFIAPLIVGADGRNSFDAGMARHRRAAMALWPARHRLRHRARSEPHDHIAVEHFRPAGPFAILPMTDAADGAHRSSVVWTERGPERASALNYDQAELRRGADRAFPGALRRGAAAGRALQLSARPAARA